MENIIKNVRFLNFMHDDQLSALDAAALLYRRHGRITFKILELTDDVIRIETRQEKNPSGNYLDAKVLIERTKELFGKFVLDRKIHVVPVVFQESAVEEVTDAYIRHYMTEYQVKVKDIVAETGIDKTNVSAWINGVRPMSQIVKAMFYYYFKNKSKDHE